MAYHPEPDQQNKTEEQQQAALDNAESESSVDLQKRYEEITGFSEVGSLYEAPYVIRRSGFGDTSERKPSGEKSNPKDSKPKMRFRKRSEPEEHLSIFDEYYQKNDKKLTRTQKKASAREAADKNQAVLERFRREHEQGAARFLYEGLNQKIESEEQTSQEQEKERKSLMKPILGAGFGILFIVLSWTLFTHIGTEENYTYIGADAIEVFTDTVERNTYVFNSSGEMLYKLPAEYRISYTGDDTAAILYNPNSRKCYVVNNKENHEIFSPIFSLALSENGRYVLYTVDGGMGKYFLYQYDMENHTETLLDKQDKFIYGNLFASSDGYPCFYTTFPINGGDMINDMTAYAIWENGGKPELLGKGMGVAAYSDNQQIQYLFTIQTDGTGTYNKRMNGSTTVLTRSLENSIFYNQDYTELLTEEGGGYILWTSKGERIPISDTMIAGILLPSKGRNHVSYHLINSYGIKDFRNKVLITADNRLILIDSVYQTSALGTIDSRQNTSLSRDGRTLYYCSREKQLVRISDLSGKNKQTVLEKQVDSFRVLSDFRQVYYLKGNQLYYKRKNKKAVLLSDQASNLCMNQAGDMVFFLKESDGRKAVYYSSDGKTPKPLAGGERVSGLKEWNFGVIYQKNSEDQTEIYYNVSGSEFQYLIDGVTMIGQDENSFEYKIY